MTRMNLNPTIRNIAIGNKKKLTPIIFNNSINALEKDSSNFLTGEYFQEIFNSVIENKR